MNAIKEITPQEYESLIKLMYPVVEKGNYSEIVSVMRGGMIAAQYISRYFNLPCGVYYPEDNLLIRRSSGKILFVEDNIGVGRTVCELISFMDKDNPNIEWNFFPVFIDERYQIPDTRVLDSYRASEWLIVPGRVRKVKSAEVYSEYMKKGVREYSRDSNQEKQK